MMYILFLLSIFSFTQTFCAGSPYHKSYKDDMMDAFLGPEEDLLSSLNTSKPDDGLFLPTRASSHAPELPEPKSIEEILREEQGVPPYLTENEFTYNGPPAPLNEIKQLLLAQFPASEPGPIRSVLPITEKVAWAMPDDSIDKVEEEDLPVKESPARARRRTRIAIPAPKLEELPELEDILREEREGLPELPEARRAIPAPPVAAPIQESEETPAQAGQRAKKEALKSGASKEKARRAYNRAHQKAARKAMTQQQKEDQRNKDRARHARKKAAMTQQQEDDKKAYKRAYEKAARKAMTNEEKEAKKAYLRAWRARKKAEKEALLAAGAKRERDDRGDDANQPSPSRPRTQSE